MNDSVDRSQDPHQEQGKRGRSGEAPPPFWEWVCAGIGLLLLAGSIGYLLVDARASRGAIPVPVVELRDVQAQGPHFLVRIEVRNDGHATAAALRVQGELLRGEAVVESSEVELDYLPARSSRGAAMLFTQDPLTLRLVLTPRGWREP